MKLDSNFYIQVQEWFPKKDKSKSNFNEICIKFSEKASLYLDTENHFFKVQVAKSSKPRSSFDCLCLVLALGLSRWGYASAEAYEEIISECFSMARRYGFQGRWKLVAQLCSKNFYSLGIHGFLKVIEDKITENTFFGSILPKVYSIVKNDLILVPYQDISFKDAPVGKERLRGIKRRIRRRGYNDKGSRRPDHDKHGIPVWVISERELLEEEEQKRREGLILTKPPDRFYWKSQKRLSGSDRRHST